jgi:hypothetical protein
VKREAPDAEVTVFDNGRHHRWGTAWTGERALSYVSHGGRYSRRLHEPSSDMARVPRARPDARRTARCAAEDGGPRGIDGQRARNDQSAALHPWTGGTHGVSSATPPATLGQ